MAGSKPQPKSEDRYLGNDYLLVIKVTSNRNKALGLCYGDIEIALITAVEYNGFIHEASLWNYNGPFMGQNNVNREVINAIKAFFGG